VQAGPDGSRRSLLRFASAVHSLLVQLARRSSLLCPPGLATQWDHVSRKGIMYHP
jgi:hypothetical protein